jgi:desulfoferrodoxin (superoxide reductase-like protein)
MTQYARPDADNDAGGWTPTPLYAELDEASPDDSTTEIVQTFVAETTDSFEVSLSSVTDPVTRKSHVLRIRHYFDPDGPAATTDGLSASYELHDSGGVIKSGALSVPDGAYATDEIALTQLEADGITSYSTLDVVVTVSSEPGSDTNDHYVTWIEFSCPDVVTPASDGAVRDGESWKDLLGSWVRNNGVWEPLITTPSVRDSESWKSFID